MSNTPLCVKTIDCGAMGEYNNAHGLTRTPPPSLSGTTDTRSLSLTDALIVVVDVNEPLLSKIVVVATVVVIVHYSYGINHVFALRDVSERNDLSILVRYLWETYHFILQEMIYQNGSVNIWNYHHIFFYLSVM
jgi:hypothetical protein